MNGLKKMDYLNEKLQITIKIYVFLYISEFMISYYFIFIKKFDKDSIK